MMITNAKSLLLLPVFIFLLTGCEQPRNFFGDADDPGLSRFTARGYDIVSLYLNDSVYVNPYRHYPLGGASNSDVTIQKIVTTGVYDTLSISWEIAFADAPDDQLDVSNLSILLPVEKNFTQTDLLTWEGKRFPVDLSVPVTILLNRFNRQFAAADTGTGIIYFVKIYKDEKNSTDTVYQFSGLFEGNAGNNKLTKGRFDFRVNAADLNF
jgi:hypothetical protein